MKSRSGFVAILLLFSAVIAAAVASMPGPTGGGGRSRPEGRPGARPAPGAQVVQTAGSDLPTANLPAPPLRPPVMLVRPDPDEPSAPLALEQARYEVTVNGLSARTRATLVFRNDLGRVLDGELVFPLPEGALVSGYGLDVGGRMVDGVVVGAHEARVAFESEVRRRVDPGLVEWVRGNNFRTRVFPIPARGRRTVTFEYLSDLVLHVVDGRRDALYELPLRFGAPVNELTLKVEVVRGESAPTVRSGPANFSFARWQDRYVAETTRRDVQPGDDLRIALPETSREDVLVEAGDRSETFFVVDDFPTQPDQAAAAPPARIAVAWDASFSRAEADRERDLALLSAHLARLGRVEVHAIVFRNVPDVPRTFSIEGGNAAALVEWLRDQPCDGATNLAALHLPADVAYTVLFSDGLSTLGGRPTEKIARPLYAVSGDPRADHARLRAMAEESGGTYINLQRHTDAAALDRLGRPVFSLVSVDADPAAVADLEPAGVQAVTGGRVRIAGRLLATEARLTLRYGIPGDASRDAPSEVRTVTLRRRAASEPTGLAAQAWAQQRMASLGRDPEGNRADLVRLGQRFSLVTPGTSLLVLETIDQYLVHDVTPPATWPEMRDAFLRRRQEEGALRAVKATGKPERVAEMWQRRVGWWSRTFPTTPPPPPPPGREANVAAMHGRVGGVAAPPPAAVPMTAPSTPPPPAADAMPAVGGAASAERVDVVGQTPLVQTSAARMAPMAEMADRQEVPATPAGRIVIQAWNPDTPYLRSLRKATGADAYRRYLAERNAYGSSPAFFLDCADLFFERGEREIALRVLTAVAELRLEDARLLRVLAHRLQQIGEVDLSVEVFDRVREMRPEEPQSYRDLALALDERAGARPASNGRMSSESVADRRRALALFGDIVEREWDERFPEVEVIALVEANRIATILEREGAERPWPLDSRLRRALDFDVRVVLSWDTDDTDMDLWVVEPNGEKCYYSYANTWIGGQLSRDFTGGYGPEEYSIRRALPGGYAVKANFYGSRAQSLTGPTTVQATVITDYGRPTERRRAITLRLTSARDVVDIGEVQVGKDRPVQTTSR